MKCFAFHTFLCMVFLTLVAGLPLLHSPQMSNRRSLPPLLQPPFARLDPPALNVRRQWGPSIFADTFDRLAYPQTSTDHKARVGQLSQQIGQKVQPMENKSVWKNFGKAVSTGVSVIPMVLEAIVKQARD